MKYNTIYQTLGGSLTFPESAEALAIVEERVSDQSDKITLAMLSRGYGEDSTETKSMVQKVRLHTLRAIADSMPSVFTLSLTSKGKELLEI